MAERQFSEEERQRLAAQGLALPDGSYPVPDCDAVRRAHESFGRAPASHRAPLRDLVNGRNAELHCGLGDL